MEGWKRAEGRRRGKVGLSSANGIGAGIAVFPGGERLGRVSFGGLGGGLGVLGVGVRRLCGLGRSGSSRCDHSDDSLEGSSSHPGSLRAPASGEGGIQGVRAREVVLLYEESLGARELPFLNGLLQSEGMARGRPEEQTCCEESKTKYE